VNIPSTPPVGPELDALVMRKVFGFWFDTKLTHSGQSEWFGPHPTIHGERLLAMCCLSQPVPLEAVRSSDGLVFFSTNWTAAMFVVGKISERTITRELFVAALRQIIQPSILSIGPPMDPAFWIFYLTPEFICRAALAAMMAH
jgi:hypothetical protein